MSKLKKQHLAPAPQALLRCRASQPVADKYALATAEGRSFHN